MGNVEIIYKETYGYEIEATITEYDSNSNSWVAKDISGFNTKTFIIKSPLPAGTVLTVDASFVNDGTDGLMTATITGTTLTDSLGTWRFQAKLSNDTQMFKSSIGRFEVEDPLG